MKIMACLSAPKTTIDLPGMGQLVGEQKKTRNGVPINVFRAIPYAKPPIGKLRFGLPQPINQPFQTVLDCTKKESSKCIQQNPISPDSKIVNMIAGGGSEDCLYLNVYTPFFPEGESEPESHTLLRGSETNLPVIVWFHGGAFCVESNEMSMYGPDYLLDHDVILVGVNYRLGIFGFLSLECDEAPG